MYLKRLIHVSAAFMSCERFHNVMVDGARISFDASSETPAAESNLLIQAMRLDSGTPVLSEGVAPLCGLSAGICICLLIDIETSSGNQGCVGRIGAINNSSGTCSVFTLLRHLLIKEKGGNA